MSDAFKPLLGRLADGGTLSEEDAGEFFDACLRGDPSPAQVAINTLHGAEICHTILSVPQPIIAAVQGYAMGLGATIALFCDVVIAADDATFADTHVAVGLVAGDGGAVMWPLLMGLAAARYYLLTAAGRRQLGREQDAWQRATQAINGILRMRSAEGA